MAPEGLKSALVSVSANPTAVQPSTAAITTDHLTQPLPAATLATVAVAPTVVDTAFDAALNGRQVMPVSFNTRFLIRAGPAICSYYIAR